MTDTIEPLDAPLYPAIACLVSLLYKIPSVATVDWFKHPLDGPPPEATVRHEVRSLECHLPFGHEGNHKTHDEDNRTIEFPKGFR
jgi:hypothetical protein